MSIVTVIRVSSGLIPSTDRQRLVNVSVASSGGQYPIRLNQNPEQGSEHEMFNDLERHHGSNRRIRACSQVVEKIALNRLETLFAAPRDGCRA